MKTSQFLTGSAFALALGIGACTPMTQSAARNAMSDARPDRATLVVENNNWADMTLYLVRDGSRMRLGSAPSMSRSQFVITGAMLNGAGEVRIMADPLGGSRAWTSAPILVAPGNQVRFRLENNVSLSTYAVY
jgi:hypothetical protein